MPRLTINGQAVLAARRGIGMSQQKLATQAGITTAALREYERGRAGGAQLRTVAGLAHALGVLPADLLLWEPDRSS